MFSVANQKHIKTLLNGRTPTYASKNLLAASIALALSGNAGNVFATPLSAGSALSITAGAPIITGCLGGAFVPGINGGSCTLGSFVGITDMGGSYFKMDNGNGNDDKTALSQFQLLKLGEIQGSSGQHTGPINGSESPAVDNPWGFFGNTGMHTLNSPVSVITDTGSSQTLDFSGWGVNWGDFGPGGSSGPTIPMGGTATIVCDPADCSDQATYDLDMDVHVPVAFPSVAYSLHLEGTIALPGTPPQLSDDIGNKTIIGNPLIINVLGNDFSADGFDNASLAIVNGSEPANGAAVPDTGGENITYTPDTAPDFTGMDSFVYTINSGTGTPPDLGQLPTVTVDVVANVAPVATNDIGSANSAILANTPATFTVLSNDSDANNANGLPGGLDVSTLTVVDQPATGSCTANSDGTITYSQTAPIVLGEFTCTYRVSDIDTINTALESNLGSLAVTVSERPKDWPVSIDPDIIPVLRFDAGIPVLKADGTRNGIARPAGSYFGMLLREGETTYTALEPGASGGLIIGSPQPSGFSHVDPPLGDEITSIDKAWEFFRATGLTYSLGKGVTGNPDGSLQFGADPSDPSDRPRFYISWSYVEGAVPSTHEIDLGGDVSGTFPEDLGFGFIGCDPAPCQDGSRFELDYEAHVPPSPAANGGFGGVPYSYHLEGTVDFVDGQLKVDTGTIMSGPTGPRIDVSSLIEDTDVTVQCAGGCFDFTVENVVGSKASVVLPLTGGIPNLSRWRILDNGVWRDFDETGENSVKSAASVMGSCPDAGDAAYTSLTEGHNCIELTIVDDGPNDKDLTLGTIEDPGGLGSGDGSSGFVDLRTSSNSGCTIQASNLGKPAGTEWWLLGGFIAWLGMRFRKQR